MYQGNTYYVPVYHRLVYCHGLDGEFLILGGLNYFVCDASTDIVRQKLHKSAAWKYEFKYIDHKKMDQYPYLQNNEMGYSVTGDHAPFQSPFLVGSLVLPDAPKARPIKLMQNYDISKN